MTDPMELVDRLDYSASANRGLGRGGLVTLLTEAAACIREMVAQNGKLSRRVERYCEQVEVERKAYRNLLADYEGRPLPPAPGAEDE